MAHNIALKIAILSRDRKNRQRDVAERAGIHASRLSRIVTRSGRPATPQEKAAIARVLRKPIEELFPPEQAPA